MMAPAPALCAELGTACMEFVPGPTRSTSASKCCIELEQLLFLPQLHARNSHCSTAKDDAFFFTDKNSIFAHTMQSLPRPPQSLPRTPQSLPTNSLRARCLLQNVCNFSDTIPMFPWLQHPPPPPYPPPGPTRPAPARPSAPAPPHPRPRPPPTA